MNEKEIEFITADIISKIDLSRVEYEPRFHDIIICFMMFSIIGEITERPKIDYSIRHLEYARGGVKIIFEYSSNDIHHDAMGLSIGYINTNLLIPREQEIIIMLDEILKDIDIKENDDEMIKFMYSMRFDELCINDEIMINNLLKEKRG